MINTVTTNEALEQVAELFNRNTTKHELTINHDDGVHRHMRCGEPGINAWSWRITTWPGHLAISGDLGTWVFSREYDMLQDFFRGSSINPDYWLEKCVSWDSRYSPNGKLDPKIVKSLRHEDENLVYWDNLEGALNQLKLTGQRDGTALANFEAAADELGLVTLELDSEELRQTGGSGERYDLDAIESIITAARQKEGVDDRIEAWNSVISLAESTDSVMQVYEAMRSALDMEYPYDHTLTATDPQALIILHCILWTRKAYLEQAS